MRGTDGDAKTEMIRVRVAPKTKDAFYRDLNEWRNRQRKREGEIGDFLRDLLVSYENSQALARL